MANESAGGGQTAPPTPPGEMGPRHSMTWNDIYALATSDAPLDKARAVLWNFIQVRRDPIVPAVEWKAAKVAAMAAVDGLHQHLPYRVLLLDLLRLEDDWRTRAAASHTPLDPPLGALVTCRSSVVPHRRGLRCDSAEPARSDSTTGPQKPQ